MLWASRRRIVWALEVYIGVAMAHSSWAPGGGAGMEMSGCRESRALYHYLSIQQHREILSRWKRRTHFSKKALLGVRTLGLALDDA
ncbi:hypothetical protein Tco_1309276 [Tanacetum coccineum]